MKCVINVQTLEIVRVPNEKAAEMVATGNYTYTNKTYWRIHKIFNRKGMR